MSENQEKVKALGLCSGGLDSILAALVLQKQNIHVEWICFETPFFSCYKAKKAADIVHIPLMVKDITDVYMKMLTTPNCGYGKNMNPCLDCHSLMFRIAGGIMAERRFHFLFSGEVLGQRPMSQKRNALKYVEKHSGMKGLILRPLSAQKMDETVPEKNGWVDRNKLLNISGRGRKHQIKLAHEFGITDYPAPAGGCLLTDKGYCKRLRDLMEQKENFTANELMLLRYGRHFRILSGTKIIVGRTMHDNENILKYFDPQMDIMLRVNDYPSPTVLITGKASEGEIYLAAALCAGYGKVPGNVSIEVTVAGIMGNKKIEVFPISPEDVKHLII
jgi:tRNA-uridine 2-sulfurtransferase